MSWQHTPQEVLAEWTGILGNNARIAEHFPGRDLWLVEAEDGAKYYFKRYGPWRNLPLADEARVLRFLSCQGFHVAEFLPTERAMLYAGKEDESFVLTPKLPNDNLLADELLAREEHIGQAVAELHVALA